jgi:hypothetical protein
MRLVVLDSSLRNGYGLNVLCCAAITTEWSTQDNFKNIMLATAFKVGRMAAKEIASGRRKMMSAKISQWECSNVIVAYSVF